MPENPAVDEIRFRTVEWTRDMLLDWIATNERAQAIQRSLPSDALEELRRQREGMQPIAAAMATQLHPDSIIAAHILLTGAVRQLDRILDGSVSYPLARLDDKTDDETTRAEVGEDVAAEVAQLRAQMDRLEQMLATLIDVAERAPLSEPRVR